jgi:uncharacterized membrane protein (UPF0182 family)
MLRHPIRLVVLLFLLVFIVGPSLLGIYTDWLWFDQLGYQSVYATMLTSEGYLFAILFAVAAVWLALNLHVALGTLGYTRPMLTTREGVQIALPGPHQLRAIAMGLAVLVAAVLGLYGASEWNVWLAWRKAVPFGVVDPILGHDVGFYVFALPFLEFARGIAEALVILAALGVGAIYLVSGHLTSGFPAQVAISPAARRHLALLVALFLLVLGFSAWLGRAELLVGQSGMIFGAGYADVYGRLPLTYVAIAACVVGAGLAILQGYTQRNWPIIAAIALYVVSVAAGNMYGTLLQRFIVTPDELARETPFIKNNIDATRRAFALNKVEEQPLSGDASLTRDDIASNSATLDNVRLWDHQPLLDTFSQIQEIRTYYDFVSVDNDRYRLNGALRQVMLSARELNSNSLPNRTWVNDRLTFTHGYGLTLGPVNQVTSEGLPVLFVQNMPPETSQGLKIDQPRLYYGELSNDYVIVRSKTSEFDFPRGDDNAYTEYTGRGGVSIGSLWRRAAFALRFGAYQILLSDAITPDSRILYNRNIRDRVRTLAPFLTFDRDPFPVLANGRVYWMYDAYTTSDLYPYSTPSSSGVNYIRNSFKFVIDAYDGTTTIYLADPTDPIAQTFARIFPGTFKPLSDMPKELREHVRYPEDIFTIQAAMYTTYHMTQPSVFYNREDQWDVPTVTEGPDAQPMQPYYTIMRLPGEQQAEFIQMLPFTPRQRDNLAAWLAARSDGEHYGTLRVFTFPKQKLVFGPRQVVARINQDQTISPQITLWSQQGSEVIWGTLMVIPIQESLIYVRPLYLRGSGGRIPELRRVVVAYQNQIVMENTLEAALARLFGGAAAQAAAPEETRAGPAAPANTASSGAAPPAASPAVMALANEARTHYDRAVAAQRAGDWATYGQELRQLGDVLQRMRAQ